MKKPRGRPRKFDPEDVLQKAMLVFWERGLSATSLDDLSSAMEMNRPSIYNAFGNKEAIYRSALAHFCGRLDLSIEETLLSEPDLKKGLVKFYDGALDVYCGTEPAMGCLMMCTAPTEALVHPEVQQDLHDLITRVDATLGRYIKKVIQTGDYPGIADPSLTGKLVQSVLHSLAIRARAGESKASLKKLARYSVDCLLGIG